MGAPPFLYLKYNLFWRSIKENGLLGADEKRTTDVSQFNFSRGKGCLSPIKDMLTAEIISYDLSLHPSMAQITRMLKRAFDAHPNLRGLIFHSDQGGST